MHDHGIGIDIRGDGRTAECSLSGNTITPEPVVYGGDVEAPEHLAVARIGPDTIRLVARADAHTQHIDLTLEAARVLRDILTNLTET